MKIQLLIKNKKYFILNDSLGYKIPIQRDPNEDDLSYINKAYRCFDKHVQDYSVTNNDYEIIKTTHI